MTPEVPFSNVHIHAQSLSCVWLCNPTDCSLPGSSDFPGKHPGVGCHFLLQRICPIQGSNPCLLYLLHWQVDSLPLCHLLAMISCNYVLWASFAFVWEVIFPLRSCLKSLGSDESLGESHFSPPKAGRIENKKAWSPGLANYNLLPLHKGVTQPEMAWITVWDFKEWGWERDSFLPMVPLSLSKINLEMYMVLLLISEKLGDQVWKW